MYHDTVDGRNLAPVEVGRLSHIYKVLYISGGAGFLPSTVSQKPTAFLCAQTLSDSFDSWIFSHERLTFRKRSSLKRVGRKNATPIPLLKGLCLGFICYPSIRNPLRFVYAMFVVKVSQSVACFSCFIRNLPQ